MGGKLVSNFSGKTMVDCAVLFTRIDAFSQRCGTRVVVAGVLVGGTVAIVPSSILKRECWTPNCTSLKPELPALILSISSMKTMPCWATPRSQLAAWVSLESKDSTSSPTQPASVRQVASPMAKGDNWCQFIFRGIVKKQDPHTSIPSLAVPPCPSGRACLLVPRRFWLTLPVDALADQ